MTSGLKFVHAKFEGCPLKVKFVESAYCWFGFHLRRPPSREPLLSSNRFVKTIRCCLDVNAMYDVKCHLVFLSLTCDSSLSAFIEARIALRPGRWAVFPYFLCPFRFLLTENRRGSLCAYLGPRLSAFKERL